MSNKEYDAFIVGVGLCGSVLARLLAEQKDLNVLLVDRRDHIAGNLYDYKNESDILVQAYGPHVFHTNSKDVYSFISRFCKPVSYRAKCEAVICNIATPSPFNFKTIDQFAGSNAEDLKERLLSEYNERSEVPVLEMLESDDKAISSWANFLFEEDYRPYTAKQWDLQPEEIDPSVLARVPIVLSYRDTYFDDLYEFMPDNGFTNFIEKVLDHPNIETRLACDAQDYLEFSAENKSISAFGRSIPVVYTGAIDELFDFKYGYLPYRGLRFEYKTFNVESFQNVAITAYPKADGYTRITEFKKMPYQNIKGVTTVAYEYPVNASSDQDGKAEPYYPVLTDQSKRIYENYLNTANEYSNLYLCGRLADFRYYNMDQAILRSFEVFDKMKGEL